MPTVAFLVWSFSSLAEPLPHPEIAFMIPERDLIPEGIAYDPVEESFYVSSTYRRKIVRVNAAGDVEDFVEEGASGLWGVVGMTVDAERRLLWAASSHAGDGMPMVNMSAEEEGRSGLFAFHLDTGELAERFVLTEGGHFLNDVALTPSGDVLVTDSRARVVYRAHLDDGGAASFDPFIDLAAFGSPNGITLSEDGNTLFVAVGPNVAAIRMDDLSVQLLPRPDQEKGVIDGLYFSSGSLIAMQPFVDGAYVVRLLLGSNLEIVEAQPLVARHETLDQPTTGVIVDDELFFIANAQLQRFRKLMESTPSLPADASLAGPVVLRVPIE